MDSVKAYAPHVGTAALCRGLGLSRATVYRLRAPEIDVPCAPRPTPSHALSESERQVVLDLLHGQRFVDRPPADVVAALLDEGRYLCSTRTMYRILDGEKEVKERRNQRAHPIYERPELLATRPNEVWSWDITRLKGPVKWTYYQLYVILDIFSRYVVGWMVAERESSELAKRLIRESCLKQEVLSDQLTLHADRGSSMKSKPLAMMLSDLGVTKTHSRPHVSNDNPYSESHFKTLKYRPGFPERFGSLQDARTFCQEFFTWYNTQHHHSGIAWLTPEDMHYGRAMQTIQIRQQALDEAFIRHPERFRNRPPQAAFPPVAVWINPPKQETPEVIKTTVPILSN